MHALKVDPELRNWATPLQKKLIDSLDLLGSAAAVDKAFSRSPGSTARTIKSLERRAEAQGYSPRHDMRKPVPDGFKVKGISTFYDRDGNVRGQWVKSREDRARLDAMLREYVVHLTEEVRALYPATPAPAHADPDLLAVYLFGDPHFGLRAVAEESGEDFDLDEADRITRAGIDRLAAATPQAETALLIVIGDNTHANDSSARTPASGNALDVDGRHHQAVLASAKAWTYAAKRLLAHHARVKLWFLPGNHDPDTAFALALCLSMYFEAETRIEVDVSPSLYRCMRFGKVLVGAHHGHGAKQADLPLLMAVDWPEDWGASSYRYVYQGHVHHDSVKEIQGVRVESIRSLAAKDAWHAGQGYRSLRDTRAVIHHKDFGEIERFTCSAAMLPKP